MESKNKVSEIFAENVFTDKEMKKRLRGETYAKYKKCIDTGVPFDRPLADELAAVEVSDFVAVDHIDIEGVGLCGGDVAAECEGTE